MKEKYKEDMRSAGFLFVAENLNDSDQIAFVHKVYGTTILFSSWDKIPGYLNAYAA